MVEVKKWNFVWKLRENVCESQSGNPAYYSSPKRKQNNDFKLS